MSGQMSIPMQEYQNNSPLTVEIVQKLLDENHEARRPRRWCSNASRSVVYTFLMAGIAYCIVDMHSLRKLIQKCMSTPPKCASTSPYSTTYPTTQYLTSPSTATPTTCPSCPTQETPPEISLEILKSFDNWANFHSNIYLLSKKTVTHDEARVSRLRLL